VRRGFSPSTSRVEDELDRAVLELLEAAALTPPRLDELAAALAAVVVSQPAIDAAIVRLVAAKKLVRVLKDTAFASSALAALETRVRAYFAEHEWLDAQALKELTGASRRFAIPLGEWLDRAHITVRVGDRRRSRKPL